MRRHAGRRHAAATAPRPSGRETAAMASLLAKASTAAFAESLAHQRTEH